MDDQAQKKSLQDELDELLTDVTKDQQEFSIKSKVLVAKADKLADELEKTDFSDLVAAEEAAMKDLKAAVAEEVTSLELEDEGDSEEETSE
ncbi:MAG: hypothetical protein WCF77_01280 [Minisyncoccia bacterium]|jgi:hypothetical protein